MQYPIFDNLISRFLGENIIDLPYIYIDFWSFIHFISGFALGWLLKSINPKYSWAGAFVLLVTYEIFEFFSAGILFVGESPIDTLWDLIIGMAGFASYALITKKLIRD